MKSLARLKKDLWRIVSLYIRERDKWTCITCGFIGQGAQIHAGHFLPKASNGLELYFHEWNLNAQCARCNLFLDGNQYLHGEKIGKRRVNALRKLQGKVVKWNEEEFIKRINYFKKKYKKVYEQNHKS